jgi:hypothetical protein
VGERLRLCESLRRSIVRVRVDGEASERERERAAGGGCMQSGPLNLREVCACRVRSRYYVHVPRSTPTTQRPALRATYHLR